MYQEIQAFDLIPAREFSDIVALSQMTPGPIAVNAATYVGYKSSGFLGAIFALLPLNIVQNMLNNVHKFFMIPSPLFAENIVVMTMFFVGILFGAGGSFLSIKKHLQV